MNLIILTGNQFRHKYFANKINEAFKATAVFSEGKVFNPSGESSEEKKLSPEEKELWDWHFGLAKREEANFFGNCKDFECQQIFDVPKGEINSSFWREKISSLSPDIVVVFGTSLLKDETISVCKEIINMHLGLSPYYRGSGTNFWPLHNREPEYVGVTIHKIDIGIDTGEIVHQGRPVIEKGDNQHVIGNKTIEVGTGLMIQAIKEFKEGSLKSFPQTGKGKLYQRKDFKISHIKNPKTLMEGGMIDDYVERNAKAPIEVVIVK